MSGGHAVDPVAIAATLASSRGFAHKRDIADVLGGFRSRAPEAFAASAQAVPIGDDCAAIPDGSGFLLFAIEGFVDDFVQRLPWFAGWCAVMVNASDVAAMGGRSIAVVDALWSSGNAFAADVLAGMGAASSAYGIPVVGGHSNARSDRPQLAAAIVGRARRLLTSFDARPSDRLLLAVDLRGTYEEPFPYWNAATSAPPERLRGDLELLPRLAEDGLCLAAKDISMAGAIGTAVMLLEASRAAASIDLDAIPRPPGVALSRWLASFPSFGFVLAVEPRHCAEVVRRFEGRGIACADVGEVRRGSTISVCSGARSAAVWDWAAEPFIAPRTDAPMRTHRGP